MSRPLSRTLQAGIAYFGVVFALGFVLGTLRVLVLAPTLGSTGAVLVEIPVMLMVSWIVCGWLIARFAVPPNLGDRLLMGAPAIGLLLMAELGVSVLAFGRSVTEHIATYRETDALLGLAAQIAFAIFPVVRDQKRPLGRSGQG
jgi:hypothetical protein